MQMKVIPWIEAGKVQVNPVLLLLLLLPEPSTSLEAVVLPATEGLQKYFITFW